MADTTTLLANVRKVLRVHSGEEFEASDFPTPDDGKKATAALDALAAALRASQQRERRIPVADILALLDQHVTEEVRKESRKVVAQWLAASSEGQTG